MQRLLVSAAAAAFTLVAGATATKPAYAQLAVEHVFVGADGANPVGDMFVDKAGNVFGTTPGSGNDPSCSCGVLFGYFAGSAGFTVLHTFAGGNDGTTPYSGLVTDAKGRLYGATATGGPANLGTIYELEHSSHGWRYEVVYAFGPTSYAHYPTGTLVAGDGNTLLGTAQFGASGSQGAVYALAPSGHKAPWNESVLYTFEGSPDGGVPYAGLIRGNDGAYYGTTQVGGTGACKFSAMPPGCGTVFRLSKDGGGWRERVLHSFAGNADGAWPKGKLAVGPGGVLYGTTLYGGESNQTSSVGTVFALSPPAQ
ncbi:MAG: hypothetical protein JOZ27_09175 [Caulobacteraceae bacterium]|nr:hypothetical protein [Caulobacteraceae bacterium]